LDDHVTNKYNEIPQLSSDEILDAITRDDPDELRYVVLSAALYNDDRTFAEGICLRLARHADPMVRGNSILGFGHLARGFRRLSDSAKAVIEAGLKDPSEYVRGQSWAAADDVEHFLGWRVSGFEE